jgi:hypothetical protein
MRALSALIGVLAAAGLAEPAAVKANPGCIPCRALAHFRTCDRPLDGRFAIRGTVAGVDETPCSQVLVLEVSRASAAPVPGRIWVDLGGCAIGEGKPADAIDVAVRKPRSDNSRYALACRHW